jgi:alcohol dehydrogenase YqhD (iron-dependent ADH family)
VRLHFKTEGNYILNNFDLHNPTHILFGKGRIADLAELVPSNERVLIIYGGGSAERTGVRRPKGLHCS